jgi:hypothetical protein
MRNKIVANGAQRLRDGRKAECLEAVRAKYGDEGGEAGFLKRIWLRWLSWHDGRDEKQSGHRPSPGTLW